MSDSSVGDVRPGQVWRDRKGTRLYGIDADLVGDLFVSELDKDGRMVGPRTRIDEARFAASHVMCLDETGQSPTPPAPEFRVGDCVRLKCGGPPMVVVAIGDGEMHPRPRQPYEIGALLAAEVEHPKGHVRTQWHLENGDIRSSNWLDPVTLVRCPESALPTFEGM